MKLTVSLKSISIDEYILFKLLLLLLLIESHIEIQNVSDMHDTQCHFGGRRGRVFLFNEHMNLKENSPEFERHALFAILLPNINCSLKVLKLQRPESFISLIRYRH